MFYYFICALILLNAFSSKAEECEDTPQPQCKDRAGPKFCNHLATYKVDGRTLCMAPGYETIAKKYCANTCDLCDL